MQTDKAKELCEKLTRADAESDVIELLKAAGYWDDPDCWRYYGDNALNWSQARRPRPRSAQRWHSSLPEMLKRYATAEHADLDPGTRQSQRRVQFGSAEPEFPPGRQRSVVALGKDSNTALAET